LWTLVTASLVFGGILFPPPSSDRSRIGRRCPAWVFREFRPNADDAVICGFYGKKKVAGSLCRVYYDGSEPSKKALKKSVNLAGGAGSEPVLLRVTQPVCPLGVAGSEFSLMDDILHRQTAEIPNQVHKEVERGALKVRTEVRVGSAGDEMVEFTDEEEVDIIVVGSRGRNGAEKFFVGSVLSRVSSHAGCSVVIVR